MAPPVAAQVLWAMRALDTPLGQQRVRALRENTRYFRGRSVYASWTRTRGTLFKV